VFFAFPYRPRKKLVGFKALKDITIPYQKMGIKQGGHSNFLTEQETLDMNKETLSVALLLLALTQVKTDCFH
jgi:hypothetical protein